MPNPNNDLWVCSIMGDRVGYFVEVGAADGVSYSSCYKLDLLGWKGICVEPSLGWFPQLVLNRPNSICENVCMWSHEGTIEFSDFLNNLWLGSVKDVMGYDYQNMKKRVCPCKTFRTLLAKHNAPQYIDFISIDAEGSDGEMLSCFPFDKYHVSLFAIEASMRSKEILAKHNYQIIANPFNDQSGWDCCFKASPLLL